MKQLELTLLYLVKGDKVLLAMKKRGFGIGKWNGVGGKVDSGETVEQAMVRECQEEIGVTPTEYQKVALMLYDEYHLDERKLMNMHVYIATEWKGAEEETEEMKPEWFNQSELPFKQMWPADVEWLPQVLAGKKLRGTYVLNNDESVKSRDVMIVQELSK